MEHNGFITTLNKSTGNLETVDVTTGAIVKVNGRDSKDLRIAFSWELAQACAGLIREGYSIRSIGKMSGMPSEQILHAWQAKNLDVKKLFQQARADRAEYYHDRAVEIAVEAHENGLDKDEVPATKLAIETLKWAAEKGNPERYGAKVNAISSAAPLQIIVNTGIIRDDNEPITVEVTNANGEKEKIEGTDLRTGESTSTG